jgi:hypothetical protein
MFYVSQFYSPFDAKWSYSLLGRWVLGGYAFDDAQDFTGCRDCSPEGLGLCQKHRGSSDSGGEKLT